MPAPQFVRVNVNEALRNAVRLFEAAIQRSRQAHDHAGIVPDRTAADVDATPTCSPRVPESGAERLDAMPAGGTLTLRTSEKDGNVRIEVADTGKGLTPEECSRYSRRITRRNRRGPGSGSPLCNRWSAITMARFRDQRRGARHNVSNRFTSAPGRPSLANLESLRQK